VHVDNQRAGKI